jgi:hypothetical protein
MEFLILAIGAIAFWLLYGRNSGEPKTPMTDAEAFREIHRLRNFCEWCWWVKVLGSIALLTIPLGALLTPAIGLLAATVIVVLLFWPR